MKMKILKPLFISVAVSFIVVLCGWIWSEYLFEESNKYLNFVGVVFWWLPGVMILSIFKGGWAVIHLDLWITLTPVVSFLFWIVVLLAVRKVFLVLKKKSLKHQRVDSF